MNNYFFSKENVEKLTLQLGKLLNIKNTPESKRACRKFVETQMKSVYDKYSDKKPKKMPIPEFLHKLNQKALEDCIRLYEIKTGKKSNNGSINVQRDREIYGNRDKLLNNRPMHTSGNSRDSELPGMLDTMGSGNFAPISSLAGPGEFITATGEMGNNMQFTNGDSNNGNYDQSMYVDKKNSVDDLERRMMERQNEYQARPMNMNSFGGNMNNMFGSNDMMFGNNNTMYNPNQFNNNQRPPDINFALDGGDTRRTKEREEFMKQITGGNQNNNDNNFMGFDGNMGGNGMGFDMMGLGLMGNNLGQNMMGNSQQNMMGNMQQNMMGNMQQNMMGNPQQNMMGNMQQNMMGNIPQNMMGNPQQNMIGNMQQNIMGNMHQNDFNNDNTKINETDLKKKLNDMMQDRRMTNVQKNGKFNPMMSPSMINSTNNISQSNNLQQMLQNQQMISGNNNLNFHKGGLAGFLDNQMQINNAKYSVASSYGIDLKKIQTMSSKDIEKLLDKIKNNVMIGAEEITNKGSENIDKSDKKKLLDLLKKAKKLNKNTDELSEISEEVNKKKIVKFDKKTITKKYDNDIDSDEKSEIKQKKAKLISIKAEEYTEPEYFNDYMVELPNSLKNITGIEILDYSFPKELCYINENNNKLIILIDEDEKTIELENGNYSIDEIVDSLQTAFDNENMNLNIDIDDNEHIVLSSTGTEFSFKNSENNSLGRVLGFIHDLYENERVYISEDKHTLVSKIYFYIENISNNEPFGIIDLKNKKTNNLIKKFNQPIKEIKEMILKFKRRQTKEDDLINFYNKPHKLTFKFESKN